MREAAALHFWRSLSSAERSVLAEVRGALRTRFEKEKEAFNERSADELGPQECFRALERAWRLQRTWDVLLAVRLGDALDVWGPFDDLQCPNDPGLLRPGPRPCTPCLPAVEDAGGGRWSWLLARFGLAPRKLRA